MRMRRILRTVAVLLLVALALALYREWVKRNKPPIFLPLGFFETTLSIPAPEEDALNPANWEDPIASVTMDPTSFDREAAQHGAEEREVDIIVTGATFGGMAAALSAADDGASALLVADRDWRSELVSHAATYASDGGLPGLSATNLERELEEWTNIRRDSGNPFDPSDATPRNVLAFFESRVEAATTLEILSPYIITALGHDGAGHLDRALLQKRDTYEYLAVRFQYLLDGTSEGSTFAKAGIPTASSWQGSDRTGETIVPSDASTAAIIAGYTMSGRTVAGLGKRLDGARMHMGIIDRGYNGRFVPPSRTDDCWMAFNAESKDPFIEGQRVLRTLEMGCTATMRVESPFADVVELFFINHGNDGLSASVTLGSGAALRVVSRNNPSKHFIRIGAFPIGPDSPITVDLESVLPNDRIEGLIVRKLNVGAVGARVSAGPGGSTAFSTDNWEMTAHDIYLRSDSVVGIQMILVDGRPYDVVMAGPGTFAAYGVPLAKGDHEISAVGADAGIDFVVVPVAPHRHALPLAERNETAPDEETSWTFSPDIDGPFGILAPSGACAARCTFTLTESGASTIALESATAHAGSLGLLSPIGIVELTAGRTYSLTTSSEYDAAQEPIVYGLSGTADIWTFGIGAAHLPEESKGMYDIWVKSQRSNAATVIVGDDVRTYTTANEWVYAGTEYLLGQGVSATAGGGGIELLAIPNTMIETYHLPLYPREGGTTVSDLPQGTYSMVSFGIENPVIIDVTRSDGRPSQQVLFEGDDGLFHAAETLTNGGGTTTFTLTNSWPQQLVLYEAINNVYGSRTATRSGSLLPLLSKQAMHAAGDADLGNFLGANSYGILLFEPWPGGIAPITIGTLDSTNFEAHVRRVMENAYLLLRHGKTRLLPKDTQCSMESDPSCDPRRFVRLPWLFGSEDGQSPSVVYADGRRLAGRDTLTATGAFALQTPCDFCHLECVKESAEGAACLRTEHATHASATDIVSFAGTNKVPTITSLREQDSNALPLLFKTLRQDGVLTKNKTYFESPAPARDVTLRLGMLLSASGSQNILPANSTVSATHAASRALRSPSAQMAIGSAAAHAATFAMAERTSLDFILQSPDAMRRLQLYLVDRGVMVSPLSGVPNDTLLIKAIQRRLVEGRAELAPVWSDGRLSFSTNAVSNEEQAILLSMVFGNKSVRTIGDALSNLPGSPSDKSPLNLFRFGLQNGFLNNKIFNLTIAETMQLPLGQYYILKSEYLFLTQ